MKSAGVIEQLKTVFLEMPYKGEDGSVSMYIFLPVFTVSAIDELLENITPEILDDVFSGGLQREVDVKFPKISFERKFELVPVCSNPMKISNFLYTLCSDQSNLCVLFLLQFEDSEAYGRR